MIIEAQMITVEFYTRKGCHLCEAALEAIRGAHCSTPFRLQLIDVDGNPEMEARYGLELPVVIIDGRKAFKVRVDPNRFCERLRLTLAKSLH